MKSYKTPFIIDEKGCWVWQGYKSRGYGFLILLGKTVMAHRFMYEKFKGPIPEGKELHHKCHVRNCVNPDHLEPIDHADNAREANSRRVYKSKPKPEKKPRTKGEKLKKLYSEWEQWKQTALPKAL